ATLLAAWPPIADYEPPISTLPFGRRARSRTRPKIPLAPAARGMPAKAAPSKTLSWPPSL
ncbi:MAG: hypothetical protein ACK53T_11450, partial [Planctomycetota bacterium]